MDPAVLAALVSAIVALLGTGFTFLTRHRESSDKRIDMAFNFNQELIEDLRAERAELRAERVELSVRVQQLEAEVAKHREMIAAQDLEVRSLRRSETEMRDWADLIMHWAAEAVEIVRDLGGVIDAPPDPPTRRI